MARNYRDYDNQDYRNQDWNESRNRFRREQNYDRENVSGNLSDSYNDNTNTRSNRGGEDRDWSDTSRGYGDRGYYGGNTDYYQNQYNREQDYGNEGNQNMGGNMGIGRSNYDRGGYGNMSSDNYRGGYNDRGNWGGGQYGRSDVNYGRTDYDRGYGGDFYGNDYRGHANYSPTEHRGGYSSTGSRWENQNRGYGDQGSQYSNSPYNRGMNQPQNRDRDFWDRAGDEVASWFGDRDAERRRASDRREGDHRGRGPRGYRRSDDRINEDVNDRLSDDSWLDASDVEVKVKDGDVILTGHVNSRMDKRRIEDIAESISGVRNVENRLRVGREERENIYNTGTNTNANDGTERSTATSRTKSSS